MQCKFRGTLVHADKFERPLHHLWVELCHGGLFGSTLAGGYTDSEGLFELSCSISSEASVGTTSIVLNVYDEPWLPHGNPKRRRILQYSGLKGLANLELFEFGKVRVPYWEYEPEWRFPTPRLDEHERPPQGFAPGFYRYAISTNLWLLMVRAVITLVGRFVRLSVAFTQRRFPENFTMRTERQAKGKTRADEWFADRTLNGFNPVLPCKTRDEGVYFVRYDWTYFDSDGVHDLPRVEARFRVEPNAFSPIEIDIELRRRGETSAGSLFEPKQTYKKGDAAWAQAKRVFRCAWAGAGETETHLCQTHLNVGQYACAAFRNLRQNPVRNLLFPHLQEVVAINDLGASAIFGPQGVLSRNTPLTPNACWHRLLWWLGQLDWAHWAPRKPLTIGHRYAKAANLFWGVVTDYVDRFFAANEAGIRAEWHEVHALSFDLVEHAVEHVPYPFEAPYDTSEISVDPQHVRQNGSHSAVSPITARRSDPSQEDIGNLKQVCRYAIFHATFFHSWTNDGQVADAGEVAYASLGLRNGSMAEESDERVEPLALEAVEQLFMVNVLSRTVRGLILKNDLGDTSPELIQLLFEKREAFGELEVDAAKIRSRINI